MADEKQALREAASLSEENDVKEKGAALMTAIKKMDNPCGLTPKAQTAKQAAMSMLATKNGLYARVPLRECNAFCVNPKLSANI